MPSIINQLSRRDLRETFDAGDSLVVVSLESLTVKESEGLRTALAAHGVRLRVVPNRIARIALEERGFELPADVFKGPVAVASGTSEQAISAAKVVDKSELKKAGKLAVRAGVLEGDVLGASDAAALADVPDRDTLRAMILGALSAPARQIATLVAAPGSSLARVLQAKIDADGGAAEGDAA